MREHDRITEAAEWIGKDAMHEPEIGLVLGSGLGDFAETLGGAQSWDFAAIPHFRQSQIAGHKGKLWIGKSGGRTLAVLQGRYHYYEGHDMRDVVFPARVLARLGISTLLLTNAAGGIGAHLQPGDLMIIADHINLMGVNPLRGENDDRDGPRFPDMSAVYDAGKREILAAGLQAIGRESKSGVYAALSGPSYETPAEIRMLRSIGADAVGMSTVPEAIAARHMGIKVAGVSCITNLAAGISPGPLSHAEVTETAGRVRQDFIRLLNAVIPRI